MIVLLAYALIFAGLAMFGGLVFLDQIGGYRLAFPYSLAWMAAAMIPAAGVALLFYGPARDRADAQG